MRPGTLGKAVPGFEVKVCDEDGNPVPPGEPGRLWVKGHSRAIGYWQEMEKTAETFRGEWVVTGDLLVQDADGYFSYCGRADDVLKVGGRWLVPGEVEACSACSKGDVSTTLTFSVISPICMVTSATPFCPMVR